MSVTSFTLSRSSGRILRYRIGKSVEWTWGLSPPTTTSWNSLQPTTYVRTPDVLWISTPIRFTTSQIFLAKRLIATLRPYTNFRRPSPFAHSSEHQQMPPLRGRNLPERLAQHVEVVGGGFGAGVSRPYPDGQQ